MKSKIIYSVDKMRINDSWYAYDGQYYHAYYLQYPEDGDLAKAWTNQTVGHSISADLIHWEYRGTVLSAVPGTWNDIGIATGSVVKGEDRWYMLYTGNSSSGAGGIGLAQSVDLNHWEPVGDAPVIDRGLVYQADYQGTGYPVKILADPYIYPTRIGEYYYVFINSMVENLPLNQRGCQLVFKTKDMIHYQVHRIALLCENYDRLETAQIWKHKDCWYMYFGGVVSKQTDQGVQNAYQENRIYWSGKFDGPYHPCDDKPLIMPDGRDYYILKVLQDLERNDCIITNVVPIGAAGLYQIRYGDEHHLEIEVRP